MSVVACDSTKKDEAKEDDDDTKKKKSKSPKTPWKSEDFKNKEDTYDIGSPECAIVLNACQACAKRSKGDKKAKANAAFGCSAIKKGIDGAFNRTDKCKALRAAMKDEDECPAGIAAAAKEAANDAEDKKAVEAYSEKAKELKLVELTKVDITKDEDFIATKASVYGIHLGMPAAAAWATAKSNKLLVRRVTEARIEAKATDGAKKALFVFFVADDKVVRLELTSSFKELLVGGTQMLVRDYGIIDVNRPVKDWLGEAEVQNDWRFYDKRGVQVVARLNRGACTLYEPPCGGVAGYKRSCKK